MRQLSIINMANSERLTRRGLLIALAASASLFNVSAAQTEKRYKVFLPVVRNNTIPSGVTRFGIEVEPGFPTQMASDLAPGLVRFKPVIWGDSESLIDNALSRVSVIGSRTMVVVQGIPDWIQKESVVSLNGVLPEKYLPDYKEFIKRLVTKYSQKPYNIKYWEILNEPDYIGNLEPEYEEFLAPWGQNPAEYANYLKTAYQSVKSVNPDCKVIFGSLAFDFFTDQGGIFRRDFLEKALSFGKGEYFDGLGFHYYPGSSFSDLAAKVKTLTDILAKYNLKSRDLYLTETGYPSGNVPGLTGTEDSQARWLLKTFTQGLAANLSSIIWYRLKDAPWYGANSFTSHGLITYEGKPKLSYQVFQTASFYLGRSTFIRTLNPFELGTADLEGYLFKSPDNQDIRVVWSNTDSSQMLTIPNAKNLKIISKEGVVTEVNAASILITPNPVYLLC